MRVLGIASQNDRSAKYNCQKRIVYYSASEQTKTQYGQLLGNAARKEELDVDKSSCCIQLRNINKKIIRNMYNNEMIILLSMGASVLKTLYSDVTTCFTWLLISSRG